MACAIMLVMSAWVIIFADGVASGGGGGFGIAAVAPATSCSMISWTCAAVKVVLSAVEFLMKSLTSIVQ